MTSVCIMTVLVVALVAVTQVEGIRRTSAYYSMPSHNLANVLFARRQTRMARYMLHPYQMGQFAIVQNKGHWDNVVVVVDDSWRVGKTQFDMSRKLIDALIDKSHASHQHPDRLSMAVSMTTLSHPYYAAPLSNNARQAKRRANSLRFGGGLVDKYSIERALRTAQNLLLDEGGDRLVVLMIDANNLHPQSRFSTSAQYPTALTLRENGINIVVVAMGSNHGGVQQRGRSLTGNDELVIPTGYHHYGDSAKQVWHRVAQAIARMPVRS